VEHFHSVYNAIEIGIWLAFAIGFLVAAFKHRAQLRRRCLFAAVTFLFFGVSDAVELYTGAWWKPWWLLTWKALCVISLLALYVDNVLLRVRRSKPRSTNAEALSDDQQ
jgi:hypothetical protein